MGIDRRPVSKKTILDYGCLLNWLILYNYDLRKR